MSGAKTTREWTPRQSFLLPPSPMEWLEEGHLAYFILDVVEGLDVREIERAMSVKDARGTRPYAPRMMLALLLYGYCVGVYSSRKIERGTYEDVAFRVLGGGEHPHFTTVNEFRRMHLEALRGVFLQTLKLCQRAGMVKLGHVALDGTKMQGNASKHKAMSYERMQKEEGRLKAEIAALLERASATDAEEDVRYGEGQREEDLPAELRRRQERLARIERARQELEAEAVQARAQALEEQAARAAERSQESADETDRKRAATLAIRRRGNAEDLRGDGDDEPPTFETEEGLPTHRVPTTTEGKPQDRAQRNFTDAESRIMERGGSFLQGYNCQAAVDEEHQVIVAQAVTNQCPDSGNLLPMLAQVETNCGAAADTMTADAGYWTPEAVGTDRPTALYISTERQRRSSSTEAAVEPTGGDTAREAMRAKLRTRAGRAIYARRKWTVEPVFGQVKEARGFRRFSLRGLRPVSGEWSLVCACHNLLKLFRAVGSPAAIPA